MTHIQTCKLRLSNVLHIMEVTYFSIMWVEMAINFTFESLIYFVNCQKPLSKIHWNTVNQGLFLLDMHASWVFDNFDLLVTSYMEMFRSSGADSIEQRGAPQFYNWLGTGGTVSRRTANKKLTKLYWPSRKRSPKPLIVLFSALCAGSVPPLPTFKFVPAPLFTSRIFITNNFSEFLTSFMKLLQL